MRRSRPAGEGDGAGFYSRIAQGRVEPEPRRDDRVARVAESLARGQHHPATGRSDDLHVAEVRAFGMDPKVGESLHSARADEIAARFVPGECGLVNESHLGATPSQNERRHAPGRAATNHERVVMSGFWHRPLILADPKP
jgi:hypothetical protein